MDDMDFDELEMVDITRASTPLLGAAQKSAAPGPSWLRNITSDLGRAGASGTRDVATLMAVDEPGPLDPFEYHEPSDTAYNDDPFLQ